MDSSHSINKVAWVQFEDIGKYEQLFYWQRLNASKITIIKSWLKQTNSVDQRPVTKSNIYGMKCQFLSSREKRCVNFAELCSVVSLRKRAHPEEG